MKNARFSTAKMIAQLEKLEEVIGLLDEAAVEPFPPKQIPRGGWIDTSITEDLETYNIYTKAATKMRISLCKRVSKVADKLDLLIEKAKQKENTL